MKLNSLKQYCLLATMICLLGCQDDSLPANPVLTSPITGLIINVNNEDYTAVPVMSEDGTFNDTYLLSVKIPSQKAKIVQIDFADNSLSSDLKIGDEVQFTDNKLTVTVYKNGSQFAKYWVEMSFNPPPFLYFIKSSDKDADGNRYYLDINNAQKIASGTYDEWYEGFVDLTISNWDNVGLVTSDLTTVYDYEGGPWPPLTNYSWVGTPHIAPGTGYYPVGGPWNDWKFTDDNPDIVSPGVWYISYNTTTHKVNMTMTQWCIDGTAVGTKMPMTYNADRKIWSIETTLKNGSFRFKTTPATFGDPTFNLGLSAGISELADGGSNIDIQNAGVYIIELDLSNAPYYTYGLEKK